MSTRYVDEKRHQAYDPDAQHIEMGRCEDGGVAYKRRATVADQMLHSCRKTMGGSKLLDLFKALCLMAVGALMILSFTDSAQPSSNSNYIPSRPVTTQYVKVAVQSPAASALSVDQVLAGDKKAKIGQVTLKYGSGSRVPQASGAADGDVDKLYEKSLTLVERYAERWGYPLWVGRQELLKGPEAGGLSGLWSKHALTLSILLDELRKPVGKRLQWLLFTDADAVFANHNVPLETFLPPDTAFGRGYSLLCSVDQMHMLNSGAMMLRVSQDSVRLLTTLLSFPFSQEVGSSSSRMDAGEQMGLASLLTNPRLRKKIAVVPAHWMNADAIASNSANATERAESYQYGDLLAHFTSPVKAGWHELLEAATRGDEKAMSIPLEETRYMQSTKHEQTVAHFWEAWEAMGSEGRMKKISEAAHGQK